MPVAEFHITSYDTTNININAWSTSYPASNCYNKDETSTTYAQWTAKKANSATCYVYFKFDTSSLPENIQINSVSMVVKHGITVQYAKSSQGYAQSGVQMASGTSDKGSLNEPFSESSKTATVTTTLDGVTWTESEIRDARLKMVHVTDSRYGSQDNNAQLNLYGATLYVDYEESTPIGDQHELVLSVSGAKLITDQTSGSYPIYEGRDEVISFIPRDPDDRVVVYDNDVDVTSNLLSESISNTVSISDVTTSYGFTYDSSSGYWKSNNKGKAKTCAVCRVSLTLIQDSTITFTVVNYAEQGYDFGILGKLDTELSTTWNEDTVGYWNGADSSKNISTAQIVTYEVPAGRHFIDVKYIKDDATDSNNDALWFNCSISPESSDTNHILTYTLTNFQEDHNIRIICGDASKNFSVVSSGEYVDLYPRGESSVYINSDYELHFNVQDIEEYEFDKVLDNNIDVTSQVVAPHSLSNPSYEVNDISGASYNFTLNSSTNYWTSSNKGKGNSAALCRVNITSPVRCRVTFSFINYAQATYDFGIFGEIDSPLRTDYATDTSGYRLKCDTSAYNKSTVQTLVYDIESGSHFIDVKYKKNNYTNSNNDTLQFQVELTALESLEVPYYTYSLSSVNSTHNIIVLAKKIPSYKISLSCNSRGSIDPVGDNYIKRGESLAITLTPETNYEASKLYVNSQSVNFTGNTYTLTSISQDTNVYCLFTSGEVTLYVKDSGQVKQVVQAYRKINGRIEIVDFLDIGDPNTKFIKAN